MINMAYVVKKGSKKSTPITNQPYKGDGEKPKKLPFTGGNAPTPIKVTRTNRATGESTTTKETLSKVSESEFKSGSGKLKKEMHPFKKTAKKTSIAPRNTTKKEKY